MLTAAQLEARKGRLTASRVACLMNGNAENIMQLWLEMLGRAEPEDLAHVWPVQLGSVTEQLNLDWYEMKNSQRVTRRGEVVVHPRFDYFASTLDGFIEDLNCCLECKHVGGREPLETIIERYWPQMTWQMLCTNTTQCAISVIMGANEPVVDFIPLDAAYATEMLKRGHQFMKHVHDKTPPVAFELVPPPVDPHRVVDMSESNSWSAAAADWLGNYKAADIAEKAKKTLKELVPADAIKCHGRGVRITRNRAGALSVREDA